MNSPYTPSSVEPKWQKKWADAKAFDFDLGKAKGPFYLLVMFPYPSGARLHVGHWFQYSIPDSYGRFLTMKGKDVFHPMGFDAFGLPAENYAITSGIHPAKSTQDNVDNMIEQFKRMGVMFDWQYSLDTSKPEYYRFTQWLFLQMYKHGLAYKKLGNVNYCPKDKTVLANEQVWEGKCERCGSDVVQKPLEQWYWKITDYAQELLESLDTLDWPEKTKAMQRNWIGRKEGIEIHYDVLNAQRDLIGPMNWSVNDQTLAGGFNRRLTDEWKRRIYSPRTVHLVFTPHSRRPAFQESSEAARILRILDVVAERHDIALHDACAMPDHLHLLVSFDAARHLERDIVKKLKGASAREFLMAFHGDPPHLWGEGMHFEEVSSLEQFQVTIRYIQQNPEEASLPDAGRILSKLPRQITVFTTRPDTNFGATFIVLAPEHPFAQDVASGALASQQQQEVKTYIHAVSKKTERERQSEGRKKTGVFTGYVAMNNLNGREMPIWISDFVLAGFGTGAVVGVPGHDMRDFEFAQAFRLPILRVVVGPNGDTSEIERADQVQEKSGTMVNSGFLNGLSISDATQRMMDRLESKRWGKRIVTYRLRDWLLSRQRYWGAPIPIVYDPEGKAHAIPEEHLPWLLPTDVEFKPTGESPLVHSKEFKARTEKIFGKGWRPEYDTMDTFVCSSFYYLRYLGAEDHFDDLRFTSDDLRIAKKKNRKSQIANRHFSVVDPSIEKKWLPVSMYIGGPEHACMHLIYARFVMKALKDFGFVSHDEPFQKLVHQGLITNKGAKMSKSKGNVVSPDGFVERHGSDVFRMYLMFMGPFTEGGDWNDTGIRGIDRFVQRVWTVLIEKTKRSERGRNKTTTQDASIVAALHRTIQRVTESLERLHFNTAISALMEFLNLLEKKEGVSAETAQTFALLLGPLAPHLAEELWEALDGSGFVIDQEWPTFDPALTKSQTMTIVVQVNGKVRASMELPVETSETDILARAKEQENVKRHLEGKAIRKEIYVKGRIVSVVT
ncbi:leucine--tRNA ligase [Candidatus Peregrinibacteria bacterium]|nr:leucine--tRNA ligase [Candidatus Peregrinibacteria bacterium]MBI3816672.1 leucine--tRNA ligase [Candidatus Peregrinibacteria bacterium]